MVQSLSRETFERWVRDALAGLYDPARLQTHPLAEALHLRARPGVTRAEALREHLGNAIDLLRPDSAVPIGRPEWASYRVLRLHYVRAQSAADVCRELSISESSFFRRQREALDALVSILWEQSKRSGGPSASAAQQSAAQTAEDAVQRSVSLASRESASHACLSSLVEDAVATARPLEELYSVTVTVAPHATIPDLDRDVIALRQILLDLVAEGMRFSAGGHLGIALEVQEGVVSLVLSGLRLLDPSRGLESQDAFETTRRLIVLCQGSLTVESGPERAASIRFSIPDHRARSILVIDDDRSAVGLYRRYLAAGEFVLFAADSGEEAFSMLAECEPDLVLLDVILPREDGWAILKRLKEGRSTSEIPVLICSVVSQEHLAIALGAAGVLNKPFSREDLGRAVQECLAASPSRDTALDQEHPAGDLAKT